MNKVIEKIPDEPYDSCDKIQEIRTIVIDFLIYKCATHMCEKFKDDKDYPLRSSLIVKEIMIYLLENWPKYLFTDPCGITNETYAVNFEVEDLIMRLNAWEKYSIKSLAEANNGDSQ